MLYAMYACVRLLITLDQNFGNNYYQIKKNIRSNSALTRLFLLVVMVYSIKKYVDTFLYKIASNNHRIQTLLTVRYSVPFKLKRQNTKTQLQTCLHKSRMNSNVNYIILNIVPECRIAGTIPDMILNFELGALESELVLT